MKLAMDRVRAVYEDSLREYGDTPRGAGYPSEDGLTKRYDALLDMLERDNEPITLCDFGCGTGRLLSHILERGIRNVTYIGVDISDLALSYARAKFPDVSFVHLDTTDPKADLSAIECDYLIACGVFTSKCGWQYDDEMLSFFASTLRRLWPIVRRGMAFNATSKIVRWEREDLFHFSMEDAARIVHEIAGRNVRIRADYHLFEYAVFVSREAARPGEARGTIPVMRPSLPRVPQLLPYLPRIDKSRIYTNFGPLNAEFQQRLCNAFGLQQGSLTTAASGTAALEGAILASAGRARGRTLAIVPAFTFVATAAAVMQCGYEPYLMDVDPETWALDSERLLSFAQLQRVGLVVPVAPFGRPIPQGPWSIFQEKTGIPVVIDGAASFDLLIDSSNGFLGDIPVALSFHATKTFGTGEGGAVVTTDEGLTENIIAALNFGQNGSRESRSDGINGKLSEYHAAVGLAELDWWPGKISDLRRVGSYYRTHAAAANIPSRVFSTPSISACYALFRRNDDRESLALQGALKSANIEWRPWYGGGLHRHKAYASLRRDSLSVTDDLAQSLIGLPVATDLEESDVACVVSILAAAAGGDY